MIRKNWMIVFLLTAVVAFFDAIYLTWHHYKVNILHPESSSFCSVNAVIDCDQVAVSAYSTLFGIPVATLGAFAYLFMLLFLLFSWVLKRDKIKEIYTVVYLGLWGLALFSLYELLASVFILKTICLMCSVLYVSIIVMLVSFKLALNQPHKEIFKTALVTIPGLLLGRSFNAILFALLLAGSLAYTMDHSIQNYFYRESGQPKISRMDGKIIGEEYLKKNGQKNGVVTLDSGVQYRVIKEGSGEQGTKENRFSVHYRGMLIDGTEFDSSYKRGKPVTLSLRSVIPGWRDVLPLMNSGSKWEIYVPSDRAYGKRRVGKLIPPNSTLVFELELLSIR